MNRAELSNAIVAAARAAVAAGELGGPVPDQAPLSWARSGVCSSPLALRLAAAQGRPASEVAGIIARRLAVTPGVGSVAVTGPGFLTITGYPPGPPAARIIDPAELGLSAGVPSARWPDRPRTFGNPGFCVRFAYARAAAVRRRAADLRVAAADPAGPARPAEQAGLVEPAEPAELALLGLVGELPDRVGLAVRKQSAGPLQRHLERIAEAYHDVYEQCPALPQGDEEPTGTHGARVALAEAVEIALSNGLRMLGETPRERI